MLAKKVFEQESTAARSNAPSKYYQTLVLAATQPIIFHPLIAQLKKDGLKVILCSTYQDLLLSCNREIPDILVLGTLDSENSLEIYQRCRNQWQHLPIILLVNQPGVNEYLKIWANTRGISHVVSGYPQAFPQLRATINALAEATVKQSESEAISLPPPPTVEEVFCIEGLATAPETMELGKAIAALNQLTEYSKRYFGSLVICHYWKKARDSVVETYPWLNEWEIDYCGKISYISDRTQPVELNWEQFQSLQFWVRAFLQECDRVIGYFTQMLQKKQISPEVDRLIYSPTQSIDSETDYNTTTKQRS